MTNGAEITKIKGSASATLPASSGALWPEPVRRVSPTAPIDWMTRLFVTSVAGPA